MSAFELKPCPFCGGRARIADNRPHYYTICTECGCKGPLFQPTKDEAAEVWNRRTQPAIRDDENHKATMFGGDFTQFVHRLHDPIRLQCIMSNARRISSRRFKGVPNWSLAMELFGVGATYAWRICEWARIDGDASDLRSLIKEDGE